MASAAGPRAKGTDGTDHKFRQRVDDHYKLMAASKSALVVSSRVQLVAALGFAVCTASVLFTAAEETSMVLPVSCIANAAALLLTAQLSSAAARANKQANRQAETAKSICIFACLILAAAAAASTLSGSMAEQPTGLLLFEGVCLAVGLLGAGRGAVAAQGLSQAFAQQAEQRKRKA